MERDAVVKAVARQRPDPLDMARGEIGAQSDRDVAAAVEAEHQGVEVVGHT